MSTLVIEFHVAAEPGDVFAPTAFDSRVGTAVEVHGPNGPQQAVITAVEVADDGTSARLTAVVVEIIL